MKIQEILTCEHAFGRAGGRPALDTEIRMKFFFISRLWILLSETNIQRHEKPESTRTSIFEIFGETDEFADFEMLLEKCLRAESKTRPRTAIELRNEAVLVDFLERLENGARPCDLVQPPFEDEKDMKIRKLNKEMAKKDREIADLKNRLNSETGSRQEIRQKDETINNLTQVQIN